MIRVSALAKINLFLEITGKRADGYHTLSTLFQTISLADELTFAPAREVSLTCSDPALPTDERNLVMRAARLLRDELRVSAGVRMHLQKIVPMGAGLGGGSSDAASVLRMLPRFWKRTISAARLHRLARSLGADVPFFLRGGLCVAGGIGDRLTDLPALRRQWLVLVYPGFGVPTKEAYARVRLPWSARQTLASASPLARLFNRFEDLIFPQNPALPALKQQLIDAGATGALMSGSGSSVFGLVRSVRDGQRILRQMRRRYPQSWLVHTV